LIDEKGREERKNNYSEEEKKNLKKTLEDKEKNIADLLADQASKEKDILNLTTKLNQLDNSYQEKNAENLDQKSQIR
jgi:hypothetical protein